MPKLQERRAEMPRKKVIATESVPEAPPAMSPREREDQMIALAERCAEKQLRDGTAPSQIIVHYLRLATERERLERETLALQKELIVAKTEAYKSAQDMKELYENAIKAMKEYNGHMDDEQEL